MRRSAAAAPVPARREARACPPPPGVSRCSDNDNDRRRRRRRRRRRDFVREGSQGGGDDCYPCGSSAMRDRRPRGIPGPADDGRATRAPGGLRPPQPPLSSARRAGQVVPEEGLGGAWARALRSPSEGHASPSRLGGRRPDWWTRMRCHAVGRPGRRLGAMTRAGETGCSGLFMDHVPVLFIDHIPKLFIDHVIMLFIDCVPI